MNQTDKNTGIEFNEEYSGEHVYSLETSKIIGWVISSSGGLIKDKKQANYVLVGFVVVAVAVSLFLIFGNNLQHVEKTIDPASGKEIIPGQIPGQI